jgi:Cu+-exporting ATPase
METDPVCKMNIDQKQAAAHAEHAGITYFFCSDSCHKKFVAQPEKYTTPKTGGKPSGHAHGHS